jgi:hypothetical protein
MDKSRYPSWMWQRAERVASESIAALQRGSAVVVVPGLGYGLAVLALGYLPRWMSRLLTGGYRRG